MAFSEFREGGRSEEPSPRPLLLVHGLNVQRHTWDPIAENLARDHRVITVDLRGHGDSDWSRDGYHVENFVQDLDQFVTTLDLAPFDYVGHSLGARVGIAYAGLHQERLRHLVLSDTGPEVPVDGARAIQKRASAATQRRAFRTTEEAREYYQEMHPEWLPIFHQLHAEHQVRLNWAGKLVLKSDPETYWIASSVGKKEVSYLWEMCGRIRIPVLIIRGERSTLLSTDIAERMVECMKDARITTYPTGHYVPREMPREFAEDIRSFVASR